MPAPRCLPIVRPGGSEHEDDRYHQQPSRRRQRGGTGPGSPRGAEEAGASVQEVFLPSLRIEFCRDCHAWMTSTFGGKYLAGVATASSFGASATAATRQLAGVPLHGQKVSAMPPGPVESPFVGAQDGIRHPHRHRGPPGSVIGEPPGRQMSETAAPTFVLGRFHQAPDVGGARSGQYSPWRARVPCPRGKRWTRQLR